MTHKPSAEAYTLSHDFLEPRYADKGGDLVLDSTELALSIDALCAERVNEALGEVSDTATIAYMMAHADSAEMIRTMTAERDRLREALHIIESYRGNNDQAGLVARDIARAALKGVEG